jgi:hypothetical protein
MKQWQSDNCLWTEAEVLAGRRKLLTFLPSKQYQGCRDEI